MNNKINGFLKWWPIIVTIVLIIGGYFVLRENVASAMKAVNYHNAELEKIKEKNIFQDMDIIGLKGDVRYIREKVDSLSVGQQDFMKEIRHEFKYRNREPNYQ